MAATGRLYDVLGVTLQSDDPGSEGVGDPDDRRVLLHGRRHRTHDARGHLHRPVALMAEGANSAARDRAESLEAAKARRQKIFIAVGGVALLGLVGFQLPGLFGSSSGSGSSSAPPSAGVAVPSIAPRTPPDRAAPASPVPRSIARLAPQGRLQAAGLGRRTGGAAAVVGVTLKGPAVRTKDFVVKDVFIPQIIAARSLRGDVRRRSRGAATGIDRLARERPRAPATSSSSRRSPASAATARRRPHAPSWPRRTPG